jgi:hypothetical protein
MNTAKEMPRGALRPLTTKQQRFVLALLERNGKSASYRIAYGNNPDSHVVSSLAHRVASSRAVKAALSQAEKGNFSSLTICGAGTEILALKKISNDPTVAAYVRLEALRALIEHRLANPEPEPPKKRSTIDELERVIRAQCGEKPSVTHKQNRFSVTDLDEIPGLDLD